MACELQLTGFRGPKMKAFSRSYSQTYLFFLFLFMSFLCVALAAVSKDATLLLSFKRSLPNPGVLQNWEEGRDPCYFTGVTCKGGRVSSLDLTSVELNAELRYVATFLMGIDRLEFLSLQSTNLTGAVSSVSGSRCGALLSSLDLANNTVSGSISDLENLVSCSSLKSLNLSRNNLEFTAGRRDSGGVFTGLEVLDLSNNRISGENVVGIPLSGCGNLEYLDYVYLSGNDFQGGIPLLLADACPTLLELNLSSNNLSGTVPSNFQSCSSLVSIDISRNNFSGVLPIDTLLKWTNLRKLSLSYNNFVGSLPESLSKLMNLETLDVSSNNFSGLIPSGLCGDPRNSLKELHLQNNLFTGQELMNLKTLENLILDFNELTGPIPDGLSNCTNLNWISLSNNSIPPELGDCRSLIWLDLNTNHLTGTIPPALFKQSGNIAVGLVTGKSYVTNPTFNHNGSLIFLDLSYNMLGGSIPKELGTPYYLYILNLAHNNLSGAIPVELGGLKNVNILDFSYNRLQGTIPQSLSGLSMLNDIDLSNNNLSGTIPQSGQFLTFPNLSFANNSGLCGFPLSPCGGGPNSISSTQHQKSHRRQASLVGSVAMGLLFSLFCIFGLIILTGAREALSINLATFEKPLRKLTFADLLEATNGFHNDSLIGSGGFGDVYRAQLKDGSIVAIKKLIHISGQGDREFTAEMETIGKIKHRNLVPLLGYCKVGEERLLVYEYMRLMSAMDTHLSVSTLAGTPGYVPPEYYQSFRCSTKGDVYSYGVVLLELLTGKQPTDSADFGDNNLVGWVKQHAKLRISDVFDPELMKEDPNLEIELLQHLKVACACLDDRPWRRPTMIQVMAMFKEIQAGSGLDSASTIATEDGGFSAVEMVEMSIKEVPEFSKQ
ncbi:unnamed protein product, partial [Vitis vinifera]